MSENKDYWIINGFGILFEHQENYLGTGIIIPLSEFSTGITAFRYGDELFNRLILSLGVANKLGLAGLGLRLNYHQVMISELGQKSNITIDFGGIAELTPEITVGAFMSNINQANYGDERIPVIIRSGLQVSPSENLDLKIGIEKDLVYKPSIVTGLTYKVLNKIIFRSGLGTNPVLNTFGLGFRNKKFIIDYGLIIHQVLGFSHQFTVSYKIKKGI